jgi:UPF0755 protein
VLRKLLKIFFLSIFALSVWAYFSYDAAVNKPLDRKAGNEVFRVEKGQAVGKVSWNLKDQGLIRSDVLFRLYAYWSGNEKNVQAGAYELSASMSAKEIMAKLASGQAIDEEVEVTAIEGWTRRDLAKKVVEWGMGDEQSFYFLVGEPMKECRQDSPEVKDYAARFDFLADKPACRGLEGYLFPDTYRLYKNSSANDLVLKMLQNFDVKLSPQIRADIQKQGKTIYEIVTMASVIQKEVTSEADMKTVSGIFWNRIKSGQGLESCATLAYILGVNKPIYSLEDTQIDSPYNTYRYRGLPPAPISNPGLQAIIAAVYPADTDYVFFLSRSDNGQTVFSKTYEEHLANKNKYLK